MAYVNLSSMPDRHKTISVRFPRLNGGLNLRDAPVNLPTNESPDVVNLWWEDGILRARPGIVTQVLADGQTRPHNMSGTAYAASDPYYGFTVVHAGKRFFAFREQDDGPAYLEIPILDKYNALAIVPQNRGVFFVFGDYLYYKNRGGFFRILYQQEEQEDGGVSESFTAEDVRTKAFIPTILINASPTSAAGDLYQPENRLQPQKRVTYNAATVTEEAVVNVPLTKRETGERSAIGNPAIFVVPEDVGVEDLRVSVFMPPVQSGSGTPYGPGRGKNLCDLSAAVADPYSTATYDAQAQTLHLVSDEPRQYRTTHIRVSLKANTTYTFSAYATVMSGQARIGIRPLTSDTLLVASVPVDGNGWRSTTYTPSKDMEVRLALFCTWSTVEDGDVTYSQIQLEESSSRTAYAPYVNLRPITGRESVSVTQSGNRNLFYTDGSSVVRGDGVTPVTGYVTIYLREDGLYSIAAPEAISYDCFSRTRTTLLAGTYTLSRALSGHGNLIVRVRRVSDRKILAQCNSDGQTDTFSLDESTEVYCEFSFPANTTQEYTGWVQLERGSLASDFAPYRGYQIHTVSFGGAGPVYGGTLDVTAGRLSVTWGSIASYAGETLPGEWLSDRDVYSPGATPTEGAQVVYELAAPVTHQLTAVEITTLLGENHIATDAGSVEVTFTLRDSGVYTVTLGVTDTLKKVTSVYLNGVLLDSSRYEADVGTGKIILTVPDETEEIETGETFTVTAAVTIKPDKPIYNLPVRPVDSIDKVVVDGVTLQEGSDYTPYPEQGYVLFETPPRVMNPPVNNTVEITYSKKNEDAYNAIMDCDRAAVYGGGIQMCVVLGDCPKQPNAVFWSGNNNLGLDATYWPVEYYNLVGDTEDRVCQFGKQYDQLIVFKTRSVGKMNFSVEALNDRNVISLTYERVNDRIGCDLPWSVQLVENNLVFANSSGGVYQLQSMSSAYENNAVKISDKVNNDKRSGLLAVLQDAMKNGSGVMSYDDGKHYWLCAGGCVWLWDYSISTAGNPSWFLFTGFDGVADWFTQTYKDYVLMSDGSVAKLDPDALRDEYGDGIFTVIAKRYTFPPQNFGSYERLKDVRGLILSVPSDAKMSIRLTYETDYEARADRVNVNVPGYSVDMDRGVGVSRDALVFCRRPMCRHVRHFTLRLENHTAGEELAIYGVELQARFTGRDR